MVQNSKRIAIKQMISERIEGTARIEAFSDGVIAIIITLLIFQVRVPDLHDYSNSAVQSALLAMAPKFISFAISFLTVAIFWVNHHHIFSMITHSNWKLLWYNNLLLFWLAIVPFTTAFIGDYPTQPLVVSLYALTLCLAALSFSLLGHYVFIKSDLMAEGIPAALRRKEWKRGTWGFTFYAIASMVPFASVHLAHVLLLAIPLLFVVPRILQKK